MRVDEFGNKWFNCHFDWQTGQLIADEGTEEKPMVYEVVVVLKPTKREADEGKGNVIISACGGLYDAPDEKVAILKAAAEIEDLGEYPASRLEVLVRPFLGS